MQRRGCLSFSSPLLCGLEKNKKHDIIVGLLPNLTCLRSGAKQLMDVLTYFDGTPRLFQYCLAEERLNIEIVRP